MTQPVDVDTTPSNTSSKKRAGKKGCCRRRNPACPDGEANCYALQLNPYKRSSKTFEDLPAFDEIIEQEMEKLKGKLNPTEILKIFSCVQAVLHMFHKAIHYLHKVNLHCADVLKNLSYYFDESMDTEKLQVVENRSTVGSYMWLIILCIQSVPTVAEGDTHEFEETRRTLSDIVGQSRIAWRAVLHVVDAYIECKEATVQVISSKLDPFQLDIPTKNPKQVAPSDEQQHTIRMLRKEQLKMERKKHKDHIKALKVHNVVGDRIEEWEEYQSATAEVNPDMQLDKREDVTVVAELLQKSKGWEPFDNLKITEKILCINQMAKKVFQVFEEAHAYLRSTDKYLHLLVGQEQPKSETCYLQLIYNLRDDLKSCKKHSRHFSPPIKAALVECGRIIQDELDLTEFLVMTSRRLIFESRHAVHVTYEYARQIYRCILPKYEIIFPPYEHRLTSWDKFATAIKLRYKQSDIDDQEMSASAAVAEFKGTCYLQILSQFPVQERRYKLKVEDNSLKKTNKQRKQSTNLTAWANYKAKEGQKDVPSQNSSKYLPNQASSRLKKN